MLDIMDEANEIHLLWFHCIVEKSISIIIQKLKVLFPLLNTSHII